VVLWSTTSLSSKFVRDEAQEGLDDGRLVPVLLEGGTKQPLGFRQVQAADLSQWKPDVEDEEFERFTASIRAIAPPSQPAHSLPPTASQHSLATPPAGATQEIAGRATRGTTSKWPAGEAIEREADARPLPGRRQSLGRHSPLNRRIAVLTLLIVGAAAVFLWRTFSGEPVLELQGTQMSVDRSGRGELERIDNGLFEASAGTQVQLVVQSSRNNGVVDATFEYDSKVQPNEVIQGLPGCTITVVPSTRVLRVLVTFTPGAPIGARYEVFEVNNAGGLVPLSANASPSKPFIEFNIRGRPPSS
jgi:hypothetical protein